MDTNGKETRKIMRKKAQGKEGKEIVCKVMRDEEIGKGTTKRK